MNDIEQEAIVLNWAWEMIDGMVNWAMFDMNDGTEPTNLMFKTDQHSQLFIILLRDFLSQASASLGLKRVPHNARPSDRTFLFHLRQVCADPKLGTDTTALVTAIETFASWLEGEFTAAVNLSAIDVVADLRVARVRYIQMCGDIAKHSLARLDSRVGDLRKLLKKAGHSVSEHEAYLAVDDFFERFHDDIFLYHSSHIAEFLNNIRWAIYDYLQPEFQRSWHWTDQATVQFPIYSYRVPAEISEPVAHAMYWDVMNRSRSIPWMPRFVVADALKRRY